MKKSHSIIFCFLFLGLIQCKNDDIKDVEKNAATLGNLQCQAQELRDKRFHLADEIRFADDSLRLFNQPINPARLELFDSLKVVLAIQTDQMSKRINQHLDSLWKNSYPNEVQRQKLDIAVIAYMNQNCPMK